MRENHSSDTECNSANNLLGYNVVVSKDLSRDVTASTSREINRRLFYIEQIIFG